MRVAVLASGGGTNLQALLDHLAPDGPARIVRVASNRPAAGALARARAAGISTAVVRDPADPGDVAAALGDADLVVLAGYLKLLPRDVVARRPSGVINLHPALLPAFGGRGMYGRRVHEAVLASGVAVTGATVHYVDEQYDHGPIIAQWPVPVRPGDTPETLATRVLVVEHRLLSIVVTTLGRLGVPPAPVRLAPPGEAFVAGAEPHVELTHA